MRYVFLVVSWLMLSLLAASAADKPQVLRDIMASAASQCRGAGGVPIKFEAAGAEIDLNGDGAADWVLDFSDIRCEGASSYFCGLAGCQIYIIMAQGADHISAWGDAVYAWRQIKIGGSPGLQFDMHESACKSAGACTKSFVFDGSRLREVK